MSEECRDINWCRSSTDKTAQRAFRPMLSPRACSTERMWSLAVQAAGVTRGRNGFHKANKVFIVLTKCQNGRSEGRQTSSADGGLKGRWRKACGVGRRPPRAPHRWHGRFWHALYRVWKVPAGGNITHSYWCQWRSLIWLFVIQYVAILLWKSIYFQEKSTFLIKMS